MTIYHQVYGSMIGSEHDKGDKRNLTELSGCDSHRITLLTAPPVSS